MSTHYGKLYVVATPIGNLADMTYRAVATLKAVDLIAAEDTRHIQLLLQHYQISNKVVSCHQHNEDKTAANLLAKLQSGLSVALVSDAGTPLISDPGLPVVKEAHAAGIQVVPIPGACALITALSAAGLPITPFSFVGFLPRTAAARQTLFKEKLTQPSTWVFYESSHRICAALQDMALVYPAHHHIVIARELTKLYETILTGPLDTLLAHVETDENMRKGEFVVIVKGADVKPAAGELTEEQVDILAVLMQECSTKTAIELAVKLTGVRKKLLYQAAIAIEKETAQR